MIGDTTARPGRVSIGLESQSSCPVIEEVSCRTTVFESIKFNAARFSAPVKANATVPFESDVSATRPLLTEIALGTSWTLELKRRWPESVADRFLCCKFGLFRIIELNMKFGNIAVVNMLEIVPAPPGVLSSYCKKLLLVLKSRVTIPAAFFKVMV